MGEEELKEKYRTIPEEVVHELILSHMQDYVKFTEEVLALEVFMGVSRDKAIKEVSKRYPQFNIN